MYKFCFKYQDGNDERIMIFPLAPEGLTTKIAAGSRQIETIGLGEVNRIGEIGLRRLFFSVFLPKEAEFFTYDLTGEWSDYEPINYLSELRVIMAEKYPITLSIERILPDGERIFVGNMPVSLERYKVNENAGEEGSFWVDIELMEYKSYAPVKYSLTENADGSFDAVMEADRQSRQNPRTYTVKKGDSLWKIAKLELNDGSRYKEIAQLNAITNPNRISVGLVLRLPQ